MQYRMYKQLLERGSKPPDTTADLLQDPRERRPILRRLSGDLGAIARGDLKGLLPPPPPPLLSTVRPSNPLPTFAAALSSPRLMTPT